MSVDVDRIKQLLDEYFKISGDIIINPDTGIVDIVGDNVVVELRTETKINTLPVQFGRIDGDFNCRNNQLTSLQGAPTSVGGSFYCSDNQLTSLQGAPTSVGGNFWCNYNQLSSLEHAPTNVGGDFSCTYNQLTSLQGAPTSVGRNFYCFLNQLTSLEHAPKNVGGDFDCRNNKLTSLQGAPTSVGGKFSCSSNQLTSLGHAPTSVGGNFYCSSNQLTSLQGVPKSINGIWFITVYPNTLLLRLLLIQGIKRFAFVDPNGNDIYELNHLFKKYYPQGRQGILKCGLEMMSIKNGKYANNARMGPK